MTASGTIERVDEEHPPIIPDDRRWDRIQHRLGNGEAWVTFLVVAACVAFTFKELQPSQLFKNTTPAGGDMGAHVWLPNYVKHSLLPHFRITGWTPDWYDGFPALTFYFPGPIVAIAFLSYVIPYDIAFKLVSVAGLLTLPIAAYAFGRLARMRFPGPACLAAATLPFLFSREFTIYGGNIASTMAGEFSFSIGLSIALVFLGLVARGLEDGRHRALAAVLLAAVGVCHILPLFFAIGGAVVLTAMRFDRRRLEWTLPVLVIGGALIAFWALPFYYRLPYGTNMGYEKVTTYLPTLFPQKDLWLFLLAGAGVLLSLVRRNRIGVFLATMTVLAGVVFRLGYPFGQLWNARVLPFWFLCLYLLAGVALLEGGAMIVEAVRRDERRVGGMVFVPVVTGALAFLWVNYPLHNLPFGHTTTSGQYSWLGISSNDSSFIPSWVYWNYSGYQSPGKARRQEYFALVAAMKKLGQDPTLGCGRAMWEYEPELDQMGTPDALMLLPYWTNGCIGSQEGLYYESSATTPYHFLNAAELSDKPSNPVRGLNYPSGPNVAEGVQHLQMLGVKYFMAVTPDVEAQADADSNLQLVDTVGPFPVTYTTGSTSGVQQRTWKIYEVQDSALVTPLLYQPVVMTGVSQGGKAWLTASESWYLDPTRWQVYEAASGPKDWARVSAGTTVLPRKALPPVQVSNIHEGTESISFNVDQTGRARADQDVLLSQLDGQRGRHRLPGDPEPDGGGADQKPRHHQLRVHPHRLDRVSVVPARPVRRRAAVAAGPRRVPHRPPLPGRRSFPGGQSVPGSRPPAGPGAPGHYSSEPHGPPRSWRAGPRLQGLRHPGHRARSDEHRPGPGGGVGVRALRRHRAGAGGPGHATLRGGAHPGLRRRARPPPARTSSTWG